MLKPLLLTTCVSLASAQKFASFHGQNPHILREQIMRERRVRALAEGGCCPQDEGVYCEYGGDPSTGTSGVFLFGLLSPLTTRPNPPPPQVATAMFMDSCGGHADPYHIHTDPICNYRTTESGHSTLVGVALDGYGIYGKFETGDQRPCDLDTCHGHVGPVPTDEEYGVYPSGDVYHYHVSDADTYPYTWTLGCFGSPDEHVTLETCKSLYDGCADGSETSTIYTKEYVARRER
jgi:hypothetical protein